MGVHRDRLPCRMSCYACFATNYGYGVVLPWSNLGAFEPPIIFNLISMLLRCMANGEVIWQGLGLSRVGKPTIAGIMWYGVVLGRSNRGAFEPPLGFSMSTKTCQITLHFENGCDRSTYDAPTPIPNSLYVHIYIYIYILWMCIPNLGRIGVCVVDVKLLCNRFLAHRWNPLSRNPPLGLFRG